MFYGSDFVEDEGEEAAYKLIRDIAHCMEKGTFCILLNLESIYQSFYDMLNQNFQETDGKLYCKIAIGPDSKLKVVNPAFKCALLIEASKTMTLDLPLLNRFEKQQFTDDSVLNKELKELCTAVRRWNKDVSRVSNFDEYDMFPLISRDVLKGIVTSVVAAEPSLVKDAYLSKCKRILMEAASFSGVLRMKNTADNQELKRNYIEKQAFDSLPGMLKA